MTTDEEHPGDVYARSQVEGWFQLHLAMAGRRQHAAAGQPDAVRAGTAAAVELSAAAEELAEYRAGYAAYRAGQQPHYRLVETFHRVCGSIGGPTLGQALAAGFVVTTPSPGQMAALEAGLDPDLEPTGPAELGAYAAATRVYRVRQATCHEAMRRWGWWQPADPPTASMRGEWAADMEAEDAWRVENGLMPMWEKEIADLRAG